MTGLVYRSTGSWYFVKDDTGKMWNARLKGVIKLDDITSTNPIAVGDIVDFDPEGKEESGVENTGTITKIHDRKNYITRQAPRDKYHQHIVASNLDQSILIATIKEPRTSQGFIDRFLIGSEMYHIPSLILFNKFDLYKKKELLRFEAMKEMYEAVGYPVFTVSAKMKEGVEEVKELLKERVTLISGHSGVGKSTFINALIPHMDIKTKNVSGWSGKGMHTTTFAEMFDLPFDGEQKEIKGKIIDTPGMREFGFMDLERDELSGYFPEMRKRLNDCQFNNCQHINEPGCAIKKAVMNGDINENRYASYYTILESLQEKKW